MPTRPNLDRYIAGWRGPALAALLDFEQHRLSALMPASGNGAAMHAALSGFVRGGHVNAMLAPELAASELMAIISALTDAAGRRGQVDPIALAARIEAVVLAYLATLSSQPGGSDAAMQNKE